MANAIQFLNNRQNGTTYPKTASVAFAPGMAVQINGTTGFIEPADNATPILGITNESVQSTDSNFATNDPISVSEAVYNDQLLFTVTTGPATAAMVGRYLALDAASTGVIITGISATVSAATPILVTKFINATTIQGKIAFRF